MYYKEREPRKFDYNEGPPKGIGKKTIHMIILLLFLIAAFLFFFPGRSGTDAPAGGNPNAEDTEFSSTGVAGPAAACRPPQIGACV
ncbi:MAG: hypothetical protein LBD95_06235 [Clostridiales Family XIII bacterium]|jgi:hypothetical protein|nr:hypothetical protein [Clostridiales Family XIII bacterium]